MESDNNAFRNLVRAMRQKQRSLASGHRPPVGRVAECRELERVVDEWLDATEGSQVLFELNESDLERLE